MAYIEVAAVLIGGWICALTGLAFLLLRAYLILALRFPTSFTTYTQDALVATTWAFYVTTTSMATAIGVKAWQYSDDEMTDDQKTYLALLSYLAYLTNMITLWLTKATLYHLYFAMRERFPKPLRWFVLFGVGFLVASFIAIFSALLFTCGDVSSNWDVADTCRGIGSRPIYTAFAFSSIGADIMLIITGLFAIRLIQWDSQNRRKMIVAIVVILCIGLLSACASILRFSILISDGSVDGEAANPAIVGQYLMWNGVETIAATVACSAPVIRGLVRRAKESREQPWSWHPRKVERKSNFDMISTGISHDSTLCDEKTWSVDLEKGLEKEKELAVENVVEKELGVENSPRRRSL